MEKRIMSSGKFNVLIDPFHIINKYNCIVIYGKHEEIAYSLFDEFSGAVVDCKEFKNFNLLQNSLIPEPDLKIKMSPKDFKEVFKQDITQWQRKCIILLDKKPVDIPNHDLIAEINCDLVNVNKFLEFHIKRLDYKFNSIDDLFWVKNLHDLHFANKINLIDPNAVSNMSTHETNQMSLIKKNDDKSLNEFWSIMENPWSWIRYLQHFYNYRNDDAKSAMCKHLELWSHKYVPNDEIFIWLLRSILMRN
ncbi:hypothetical protein FZC35_00615 [Candidatus Cytomitobacter indipagum]|uniref:Uncharacterized protein n=1 Tax=Candidatus Cytomitobacter indipagum TaxID=2601575 RepID=A0A5C0UD38_9PROT|nr:hypothetical protein [Candidatus Cytomitobacter indipagum]QEK37888.1 hypothetical protein FZC35_00615 [Candidatus Cytomitobacter indipagum]